MITKGFVAVGPDGTYYSRNESTTHTGTRVHWHAVDSLEQATVFPRPTYRAAVYESRPMGITMVPVQVERRVTLLGYGVAENQPGEIA